MENSPRYSFSAAPLCSAKKAPKLSSRVRKSSGCLSRSAHFQATLLSQTRGGGAGSAWAKW